jgi:hypothetical protein
VLDDRGFESHQRLGTFQHRIQTRSGPTQLPIRRVPGALCLGVKGPGHVVDHSPPSSAEVKECVELYLNSINTPSQRRDQLKNNFTLRLCKIYEQNIGYSQCSCSEVIV